MTQDKRELFPAAAAPLTPLESSVHFYGDLRKGAHLKRRAAYQLQASVPKAQHAGEDISSVTSGRKPRR